MITITGNRKEVDEIVSLITMATLAAASRGEKRRIADLAEFGDDANLTVTLTVLTEEDHQATRRAEVLAIEGRYEGTIDIWYPKKIDPTGRQPEKGGWGWITQHNGLGQAEGGKNIFLGDDQIMGKGAEYQPRVGVKITYRREMGPKGLRAVDVVMIDSPRSVEAFLGARKAVADEKKRINDVVAAGREYPLIPHLTERRPMRPTPDRTPAPKITQPVIFKDMTDEDRRREERAHAAAQKRREAFEQKTKGFI